MGNVMNFKGTRGMGLLQLAVSMVLLVIVIVFLVFALSYIIQHGSEAHGGAFQLDSAQLLKVGNKSFLAITIRNIGPDEITLLNITLNGEEKLIDLSENPIPAGIQRGFTIELQGKYQLQETYTLTIVAHYLPKETYTVTYQVTCKRQ